jgi:hypothetical protein
MSQEGPRQTPNPPAPRSWLWQPPELGVLNACCLSTPVYSGLSYSLTDYMEGPRQGDQCPEQCDPSLPGPPAAHLASYPAAAGSW